MVISSTYITMATKQTTQLCYQVNGGTCRNKVSASNNYVCAARHRRTPNLGSPNANKPIGANIATPQNSDLELSAIVPSEETLFDFEDEETKRNLALDPSIDEETMWALFGCGDGWIRYNLAMNPSISRGISQALFGVDDRVIRNKLAKNPSIDEGIQQALFDLGELSIWEHLAENPSLDRKIMQAIYELRSQDPKYKLAKNPSIDIELARALYNLDDDSIKYWLAKNPSIDREMAVALAEDGQIPSGYLANKSIEELSQLENLSLLDTHSFSFGRAYLQRLLTEDHLDAKLLIVYSYTKYKTSSQSEIYIDLYEEQILKKYPGDEELKILLS